jgi:hypothetical protein
VHAPESVVARVEKDAVGMVAFGAAALAAWMRWSKRPRADAADLSALPHPGCRSPFPAHRRIIGEAAVEVLREIWKGSMRLLLGPTRRGLFFCYQRDGKCVAGLRAWGVSDNECPVLGKQGFCTHRMHRQFCTN